MLSLFLIVLFLLVGLLAISGVLIESFVLHPKVFGKTGKKGYDTQSKEQRNRYIEFYRKICEKEGAHLYFYIALINIEKYGKILAKIGFFIVFLQIGIIIITGLSTGQLQVVK